MKISIEHEPSSQPLYFIGSLGMREFDIPEAQVDWISEVFDNFHKAQTYLNTIYRQGPGTRDF